MRNLGKLRQARQAPIKPPPLTPALLREQLPHMSPEDRGYVQHLLSNEQALKKVISETEKFEKQEVPLKQVVETVLSSANSPAELDETFWQSVKLLIKETSGRHHEEERVENVQLFVALFEAAKTLEANRPQTLASIGRYIYDLKMLRFDPVNEAEFLDALVQTGKPFDALRIWRSRLAREDTQYWWDIGVLYHLEAGLVYGADSLARVMQQQHKVPSRTVCELIKRHKDPQVKEFWMGQLQISAAQQQELGGLFEELLQQGHYKLALELKPFNFPLSFPLSLRASNTNELAGCIVEHQPVLLESPSFFTWWAHGLLLEGSEDVLDVLAAAPILDDAQAAALLRKTRGNARAAEALRQYTGPAAASVQIKLLEPTERSDYIESLECDLTPELAEAIVEHGRDYPQRLDYCINQQCWKLLWADFRNGGATHEAFERMIRSEYTPSLNLVESILQAFILDGDADAAIAVLQFYERTKGLRPNSLLFSSIQVTAGKFSRVSRADLPWPTEGALAKEVPLERFVKRLDANIDRANEICEAWILADRENAEKAVQAEIS